MHLGLRHRQQRLAVDLQRDGGTYRCVVDGVTVVAEGHYLDDAALVLVVDGRSYRAHIARNGHERFIAVGGEVYAFTPESAIVGPSVAALASPEIVAPMPGKVLQVLVQPGDQVSVGDGLLILEAMKMESRLVAEAAGTVTEVRIAAGDMVNGGQVLVVLTYAANGS